MSHSDLATWAAIVLPVIVTIVGAHLRSYMKIETQERSLEIITAAINDLKEDQKDFQAAVIQDSKELSERVRKLEVDVKEAISFSTLIKDILGRISSLEQHRQ